MPGALWTAAVLNLVGVLVFAPAALGFAPDLLPIRAPRFYAAQVGFTIALFGGLYAWLARQPQIDRALVAVGAWGSWAFCARRLILGSG
jgi:hypothetical protein